MTAVGARQSVTIDAVDAASDPDWYFEHVLADAAQGAPSRAPRGPVEQWRRGWQVRYAELDPALAARTSGFALSWAAARSLGLRTSDVRRLVRRGSWHSPVRGVLSVVVAPRPSGADREGALAARRLQHALAAGALTVARRDQVVSGRSAAVLHGLPTLTVPGRVELTGASPITAGRHGAALVRSAALRSDEVCQWFSAPVTNIARTIVDLARHDARDGLMAADAALRAGLVARHELDEQLARASGWPAIRRARRVLALSSPLAESPLESLVRLALSDDGFPAPQLQAIIGDYRVDMLWPTQRLVLEADGRVKYSNDELWREKRREHRLTQLGYRVVRVLWSDVTSNWAVTRALLWSALRDSASPRSRQVLLPRSGRRGEEDEVDPST